MNKNDSTLEAKCSDIQSRALLEDLKSSCRNGWYFETYRFAEMGRMVYKFFLIDLSEQMEQESCKFIRYFGWVEASETEGAVLVKAGGALAHMMDPELKDFLVSRFNEDVMQPVCDRHRIPNKLLK